MGRSFKRVDGGNLGQMVSNRQRKAVGNLVGRYGGETCLKVAENV